MAVPQKPIAEGFTEDLTRLLNNFEKWDTFDFKKFATVWKLNEFSCIFKGRPKEELTEFINEMYTITSKYLFVESLEINVAAVFTLYSLFVLQNEDSRIPIRIEKKHFDELTRIKKQALSKKYNTLHCVLDFLKENSFMLVANQTLFGPDKRMEPEKSDTDDEFVHLMNTYKDNFLLYRKHSVLSALKSLQEKYINEKKKLPLKNEILKEDDERARLYDKLLENMEKVVDPSAHMKNDMASRRAKLRAKAFSNKSKARSDVSEEDTTEDKSDEKRTSVTRRPRRIPKEERKVGRPSTKAPPLPSEPKKKQSTNAVDISHLFEEQLNLFHPIMKTENKRIRTRRNTYYQDDESSVNSDEKDTDEPEVIQSDEEGACGMPTLSTILGTSKPSSGQSASSKSKSQRFAETTQPSGSNTQSLSTPATTTPTPTLATAAHTPNPLIEVPRAASSLQMNDLLDILSGAFETDAAVNSIPEKNVDAPETTQIKKSKKKKQGRKKTRKQRY